jgi:hypothetical protein
MDFPQAWFSRARMRPRAPSIAAYENLASWLSVLHSRSEQPTVVNFQDIVAIPSILYYIL